MALEALEAAGVGPWADPRRIAVGLGFRIRAMTRADARASVRGDVISFLWTPDQREMGLNVFIGIAIALLGDESLPSDVYRLAGYLALPSDDRYDVRDEADLQAHCPQWFIAARRRRGWAGPGLRLCPAG